jgi:hypothetical protein
MCGRRSLTGWSFYKHRVVFSVHSGKSVLLCGKIFLSRFLINSFGYIVPALAAALKSFQHFRHLFFNKLLAVFSILYFIKLKNIKNSPLHEERQEKSDFAVIPL